MATILHSLIVDPDEQVAAHYVSALQEHGWRAQSVRSAASAAAVIADHPAEVILLGQGCSASEQSSVLKLAQKSAAVLLLGVPGAECGAGELELALHLGCAAVFRAGADAAVREAALACTVERRRAVVQVHEEMRRVKFQSEELRRRCAQQIGRAHV